MSTIDSRDIVRDLLCNEGRYPGDPQVAEVWSYINQEGRLTQAIFYHSCDNDLATSPFVRWPRLLWSREQGLTALGKAWLEDFVRSSKQRR